MAAKRKKPPKKTIEPSDEPFDDVVILIVQYKTQKLTRRAVASVRRFYSNVSILLYDNGSHDQSTRAINDLARRDPHVSSLIGDRNEGHGPAMHRCMSMIVPRYVFTLDSDAVIVRPYVLEAMRARLAVLGGHGALGVGHVTMCDEEGRNAHRAKRARVIRYLHPYAALWDRVTYDRLNEPFIHHGAPCIRTCWKAQIRDVEIINFRVRDYVQHKGRGTRTKTGTGSYTARPFLREEIARVLSIIDLEKGGNDESKP